MNVAERTTNLSVAEEFSRTPGPRFRTEGNFSGQQFREDLLERRFLQAVKEGAKLLVDLDGGYGYATSFLEEAFGGLARLHDQSQILRTLEFKSTEEPYLVEEIQKFIREARG